VKPLLDLAAQLELGSNNATVTFKNAPPRPSSSGEQFRPLRCFSGLPDSFATSRVSSPSSPCYPRLNPSSTPPGPWSSGSGRRTMSSSSRSPAPP
jgi:hypothetical protein